MNALNYLKFLLVAAFVVLLMTTLCSEFMVVTASHSTCLKCRGEKVVWHFFGLNHTRITDTEYSPWYRAHFPEHEHVWGNESAAGYDLFGRRVFRADVCSHPVCVLLPPSVEKKFAESTSPTNLALFYQLALSTNRDLQSRAVAVVWSELQQK